MKKIDAMHMHHGHAQNPAATCGGCCNFRRYDYHGRRYFKCIAYGVTHGAGTDWRAGWAACGLVGIPWEPREGERSMAVALKFARWVPGDAPVAGQMELFEEETP